MAEQEKRTMRGLAPISWYRSQSLKTKLMAALIPSVVLILVLTGLITHRFSARFIEAALSRNARQHTLAMSHEVEGLPGQVPPRSAFHRARKVGRGDLAGFSRKAENFGRHGLQ